MKVVVAQKGAREHFLAARALHRQGMLAQLVVDWYAFGEKAEKLKKVGKDTNTGKLKAERLKCNIGAWRRFQRFSISAFQRVGGTAFQRFSVSACQRFGQRGNSALAARCEALPDELVRAFPFRSLLWKWRGRRLAAQGRLYEGYRRTDAAFGRAVAQLDLPSHEVFFGYSYASLEMLEAEKRRGKLTIVDQIDPGPAEFRLVAEEMRRHPELAGLPGSFPSTYYERVRREWTVADVIVVNSDWTREAIVAEGADPAKIELLPLAFELNTDNLNSEMRKSESRDQFQLSAFSASASSPLKVLWLGQVNVRKGIHYLLEAARLLAQEPVQFTIAGPLGIRKEIVAAASPNVRWMGRVPRNRAAGLYQQHGIFVLPTLSDGFAITQLEALAHGLPVITTPNCGRVVEDGETGFIVPPGDPQALADAILRFVRQPKLADAMRPSCLKAAHGFSIDAYGRRLVEIIQKYSAARHV